MKKKKKVEAQQILQKLYDKWLEDNPEYLDRMNEIIVRVVAFNALYGTDFTITSQRNVPN